MALFSPYVAFFQNQNNWQHGRSSVCVVCTVWWCGGTGTSKEPVVERSCLVLFLQEELDQERSPKHQQYHHHHRQARPIFFGEFCSLHIRTYLVGE